MAVVASITGRESTGNVTANVYFRANAITVQMRNTVDVAADDVIFIREDPAVQGTFVFDGFVKGGGAEGAHNDSGDPIPWSYSPGYTAPPGDDVTIEPPAGQDVVIDGVNFSSFNAMQFVLMAADAVVDNERVLAVSNPLTLTDGGAGNNVTIAQMSIVCVDNSVVCVDNEVVYI